MLPQLTFEESLRVSQAATSPAASATSGAASRRGLEFLWGLLGPALGAGLGAVVESQNPEGSLGHGFTSTILFANLSLVVTPLTVWSVGNSRGGNGGYGWTALGTLIGIYGGAAVFLGAAGSRGCDEIEDRRGDCVAGLVLAATFAFATTAGGAVIGYEASNDAPTPRPRTDSLTLRLLPTFAPVRGGAVLGVAFGL
ncbi:MAG: hypothetical protein Q8S73_27020 [Deltaproteobacteria bacterium]|nr:hypothetical protein [Deltaproteobacteria bacterium]